MSVNSGIKIFFDICEKIKSFRQGSIAQSLGMRDILTEIEELRKDPVLKSAAKAAFLFKKPVKDEFEITIVILDGQNSVVTLNGEPQGVSIRCLKIEQDLESLFGDSDTVLLK